jgi:hypothetical protein
LDESAPDFPFTRPLAPTSMVAARNEHLTPREACLPATPGVKM